MAAANPAPGVPPSAQVQTRLRLSLAASLALLLHVIVGLGLLLALTGQERTQRTVHLQLTTQGLSPSAALMSPTDAEPEADPASRQASVNASIEAPAFATHAKTRETLATAAESPVKSPQRSDPQIDSETSAAPDKSQPEAGHNAANKAAALPEPKPRVTSRQAPATSHAMPTGADGPSAPQKTDLINQRSERTEGRKMTPYEIALTRKLAEPMKRALKERAVRDRWEAAIQKNIDTIIIEVGLLENGALYDASIVQSSGDKFLDRLALQAALAASPYPLPPPGETEGDLRYELEIIMSPEYL